MAGFVGGVDSCVTGSYWLVLVTIHGLDFGIHAEMTVICAGSQAGSLGTSPKIGYATLMIVLMIP